jgi:heterodisulfide reductase subunit A-like polyferredoxin
MLAASGYLAVIDHDICINCGVCTGFCQFHALSIVEGESSIDSSLCMGCGICAGKCDLNAISLIRVPAKGIPLEIDDLLNEAVAEL